MSREARTVKKMIRFTDSESEAIQATAARMGLTETQLIVASTRASCGLETFEITEALAELAKD